MPPRSLLATLTASIGLALGACGVPADPPPAQRATAPAAATAPSGEYDSAFLGARLAVHPGVFPPAEAEALFLPLLHDHAELLQGARVLDIGAGTGIIGLYALHLGASSVVATDIDPRAIENIRENARRLGLEERIDARLVSTEDMGAFARLTGDETFDLILSNPPYSLDLDAATNNPLVDTGDLGFSILRGLHRRLSPEGTALLLYNSLFYHEVVVKIARHLGYEVRHHRAAGITSWELEALFNSYLLRVVEREGLAADALRFDREDRIPFVQSLDSTPQPPLLGKDTGRTYRGFIAIRHGTSGIAETGA